MQKEGRTKKILPRNGQEIFFYCNAHVLQLKALHPFELAKSGDRKKTR